MLCLDLPTGAARVARALIVATDGDVLATFAYASYRLHMPDELQLNPATPEDLVEALSFALRFEGRRRVYHADDSMARITADRLVRYLEKSGFVMMKRPPGALPKA